MWVHYRHFGARDPNVEPRIIIECLLRDLEAGIHLFSGGRWVPLIQFFYCHEIEVHSNPGFFWEDYTDMLVIYLKLLLKYEEFSRHTPIFRSIPLTKTESITTQGAA